MRQDLREERRAVKVRVPITLYRRLVKGAEAHRLSINDEILSRLAWTCRETSLRMIIRTELASALKKVKK